MSDTIEIRRFREADAADLARCLVDEQNALRVFDPRLPEGTTMVDAYLLQIMAACVEYDGVILVGTISDQVVGFLALLKRFGRSGADDAPGSHALVVDVAVRPAWQGRGVGSALMRQAEAEARAAGATEMRLSALHKNQRAIDLYQRLGYVPYDLTLTKRLDAD